MNLLEHRIKEIHNETDVTEVYTKSTGNVPLEPLLSIDCTFDCMGVVERKTVRFWASEWERIKARGYYFA